MVCNGVANKDVRHLPGRRALLKGLLALALGGLPEARALHTFTPSKTGLATTVLYRGSRKAPELALTFDDCFLLQPLLELEKLLDEAPDVRVTFFPVGLALLGTSAGDKDVWQRLVAKGHGIGYHTYAHQRPSSLTAEELGRDYDKWLWCCRKALAQEPAVNFARPPYGDCSPSFIELCADRKLVPTLWSKDWSRDPAAVAQQLPKARAGDIVLLHVRPADIVSARCVIAALPWLGLAGVSLGELYVDSQGGLLVRRAFLAGEPPGACPEPRLVPLEHGPRRHPGPHENRDGDPRSV